MERFISSIIILHLIIGISFGQQRIEAELGTILGGEISTAVSGFSGEGYVVGIDTIGDFIEVEIMVDLAAQYKLEIKYFSHSPNDSRSILWVNDLVTEEVRTVFSEQFQILNAGVIHLSKGSNTVRLQFQSASLSVDNFLFTPLTNVTPVVLNETKTRIEAEEGLLFGTRVEHGNIGFSGQGYVSNFDLPGEDKIRILVDAPEADSYELRLGYAYLLDTRKIT